MDCYLNSYRITITEHFIPNSDLSLLFESYTYSRTIGCYRFSESVRTTFNSWEKFLVKLECANDLRVKRLAVKSRLRLLRTEIDILPY